MGTATKTKDSKYTGDILTTVARNGFIEAGYITFASAYVSGGLTCTIGGSGSVVLMEQPIPGSYYVVYDRNATKVLVYDNASGTAPWAELASDTSIASLTSTSAPRYVCVNK